MPMFENEVHDLRSNGFCVLKSVYSAAEVTNMREAVLAQSHWMPNTRQASHSRHLAGFERFDVLGNLFACINGNHTLNSFFEAFYEGGKSAAFGLSDITINRSQHWHSDLLRGRYASYLDGIDPWASDASACIKALVYLQPGKSLRVVPQSHLQPTPLDDIEIEEMVSTAQVDSVAVSTGDVVMMDIRCLHRGSTDEEMASPQLSKDPKILVSSVQGLCGGALSEAMHAGNRARLKDWDSRHLSAEHSA